tara:strand:+ start:2073 stop:2342 length:270 start_codon:yes stop_codon:yes gene_type:complete
MSFDLTGYESDNMDMKPMAAFLIGGIVALVVVIVGIYYYMFFMGEKYTQELFLERDTRQTIDYKKKKSEFLISNDLKIGKKKTLSHYND